MSETCPTIIAYNDTIVEVTFTEWKERHKGNWFLSDGPQNLPIDGDANRVIFELPDGCFEKEIYIAGGGTITFRPSTGEGKDLPRCQQKPSVKTNDTIEKTRQ